jgi:NAD(P)-dependent dehydrogenase (short-subunit alcohol dehydrogenase family)
MSQLEGRRIIVTGSGSGIGRALVDTYLTEGAKVVAVIRKQGDLDSFKGNPALKIVVGDVTAYETIQTAVETAVAEFGGLDVMVANAGRWDFYKKLIKMSSEELDSGFDQLMQVNVKAALMAAHASHAELVKTQGSFIVTGSNACFRPGGGGAIYTGSKFALRGIVSQLALEFAPDVRVNGVAPGATDTPLSGSEAFNQREKSMNSNLDKLAAMGQHIPLGRVSAPEEHTGLYVLLASKAGAKYITGTMLVSDGGLSAGQ